MVDREGGENGPEHSRSHGIEGGVGTRMGPVSAVAGSLLLWAWQERHRAIGGRCGGEEHPLFLLGEREWQQVAEGGGGWGGHPLFQR